MTGENKYFFSEPSESEKEEFWGYMVKEGLHKIVLYHKIYPILKDWKDILSLDNNIIILVRNYQHKIIGMTWINRLGLSGIIHYAILKEFRKEVLFVSKKTVEFIFKNTDLISLIASWPACYRFNEKIALEIGFKKCDFEFLKACHMPSKKNQKRYYNMKFAILRR